MNKLPNYTSILHKLCQTINIKADYNQISNILQQICNSNKKSLTEFIEQTYFQPDCVDAEYKSGNQLQTNIQSQLSREQVQLQSEPAQFAQIKDGKQILTNGNFMSRCQHQFGNISQNLPIQSILSKMNPHQLNSFSISCLIDIYNQKVETIDSLLVFINTLLDTIKQHQQKINTISNQNNEYITMIHQFQTILNRYKIENQTIHNQLYQKNKLLYNVSGQKHYWEQQFNILNHQFQSSVEAWTNKQKSYMLQTSQYSDINQHKYSQIERLRQIIQQKQQKLDETIKVNHNSRLAYKILQKQLIKINEMLMSKQIQCNHLRNQNQILAEQVQELYQSGQFAEDTQQLQCNYLGSLSLNNNQTMNQQAIHNSSDIGIFQKTRMMIGNSGKQYQNNRLIDELYQIRNLSFANSKQSLFSNDENKQKQLINNSKQNQNIAQAHNASDYDSKNSEEQADSYSEQKSHEQPVIQIKHKEIITKQTTSDQNQKTFLNKLHQHTYTTPTYASHAYASHAYAPHIDNNNESSLNKLIHAIVLRRIRKKAVHKPNSEQIKQSGLNSFIHNSSVSSWRQKIVTSRIRGRSPDNSNKLISLRKSNHTGSIAMTSIKDSSINNNDRDRDSISLLQAANIATQTDTLNSKGQLTQSMLISDLPIMTNLSKNSSVKQIRKSSLMGYLCEAVITNRIKR